MLRLKRYFGVVALICVLIVLEVPALAATIGEENALKCAEKYLRNIGGYSYQGMIDQMEYEGFTNEEATYAADNCGADWYEQSVKCAEKYLRNIGGYSYQGMIDQMEYEGFTNEEATYAADNCGADWYEQSVKCAAKYMKSIGGYSYRGLIDQMEYEGFTNEEATYAADITFGVVTIVDDVATADPKEVAVKKENKERIQDRLLGETVMTGYLLNEQNRVQNGGSFLEKDGWIYGRSFSNKGNSRFVKVRTDNTDWTVLDSAYTHQVYVIENYIYYMMKYYNKEYGIYRMTTSGENVEQLVKAYGTMQIVDDHIYYTDRMYNGKVDDISGDDSYYHLYRCDLSGKNVTEIINKPTFHAFVFDNGIIYQDDRDNMSLHICDLDGQNDIKLNDTISYFPIYDGEYIYYVRSEESRAVSSRSIWKVKCDGTEDQLVASYPVSAGMLMTTKYIYFVNYEDKNRLYRINKDGSGLTLITQDPYINEVVFLEDKINYTVYTNDTYKTVKNIYTCNYDGSGKREFKKR